MQVVAAGSREVDPTLHCRSWRKAGADRDGQVIRARCGYCEAAGDGNAAITARDRAGVVDIGHSVAEGTWREHRRTYGETLACASNEMSSRKPPYCRRTGQNTDLLHTVCQACGRILASFSICP